MGGSLVRWLVVPVMFEERTDVCFGRNDEKLREKDVERSSFLPF